MNLNDERDYAEEAANRADMLAEHEDEADVYTLITFDMGTSRHIEHIEHFSTRPADPRTMFADNPPRWELHMGNLNGGDTRKIDFNTPGHILDCYFDMGRI